MRFEKEIGKNCFEQKFIGEEQEFEVVTVSIGCKGWKGSSFFLKAGDEIPM